LKRLWAPWRMAWIGAAKTPVGCVFCGARDGADDRSTYLLERSDHAFLILNAYPYASGHLMAVVNRHVAALKGDLGKALPDLQFALMNSTEFLLRR